MSVVPALTGLDLATATAELSEVGLSVGELDVVRHPDIDSGTVVGQSPLPGQLSRPSNAVRLTLSLGPERRAVPEVVAARDDWARNLMEATGFSVRADSVESDTIPRGHVIAVVPEEGTELALPGEVSLTVSLGPRLISMPRVLGMSERQARDTLQILGLDVSEVDEVFRFGRDRGIVVEQLPPAETLLEPGAEVRLSVGRGGRQDEPSPLEQNPL
jgi:serine/threonine-protein kinase